MTFDGKQINGRIPRALDHEVTRRIQMIFQDPMASLNERAKVDYIVAEGLYSNGFHLTKAEREARVERGSAGRGPAARVCQPLPARVLRRPAAAHRHRPRAGDGAGLHHRRRAHLGAGRVHPRAGTQPALRTSEGAGADVSVHRPRSVRGALYLRPHRRHPQGRHRGAGRERGVVRAAACTPTRARCSPPSPSPTRWPSATRSCWCTTPPATITAPATSLPGRRPIPATIVLASGEEVSQYQSMY